jgi:DNA-binding MarR family transcriptional regulator
MSNNPDEHLIDLLLRRFAWMELALSERLAANGWEMLTRPQIMLFAYLHGPGSSASDIARHLRISRQAVHQMVKELEKRGLLEQIPDPKRGNAKLVIKTKAGYMLNDVARENLRDIDELVADRIGAKNLESLRSLLLVDWGEPGGRK